MDNKLDSINSLEEEKIFIHDLSSPLMIAAGWLERWVKRDPSLAEADEFRKLTAQLERLQTLVANRRNQILERDGGKK